MDRVASTDAAEFAFDAFATKAIADGGSRFDGLQANARDADVERALFAEEL